MVEEKIDGTNVGIHFNSRGRIVLGFRQLPKPKKKPKRWLR
ncbi:MAG: RNA ligase family protein [Verrucomicrobiales bacterium]|nr:RNA ligase family protein [Verrucomicrobiales bacterium]